jgi:hypothetical protein
LKIKCERGPQIIKASPSTFATSWKWLGLGRIEIKGPSSTVSAFKKYTYIILFGYQRGYK